MTPPATPPENGNADSTPRRSPNCAAWHSRPRSGRAAVAKASAIRTLERLGRERRRQEVPPVPEGWYPHEPGDPFYELDWEFLHEHPEILRRHWEMAWREGRV
jgi:hypothetical protein